MRWFNIFDAAATTQTLDSRDKPSLDDSKYVRKWSDGGYITLLSRFDSKASTIK